MRVSQKLAALVAALVFVVSGCGTISAVSSEKGTAVAGTGLNASMAEPLIASGAYAQRTDANTRAAEAGARIMHGNVQNAAVAALTRTTNVCNDKLAAGAMRSDPVLTCICTNAFRGADARERLRISASRRDIPLEPGDYGEAIESAEAVAAASGSYSGGYLVYNSCGSITGQERRLARLEAEVAKSRANERLLRDAVNEIGAAFEGEGK